MQRTTRFDLLSIRSRFPALSIRDGDMPRIYLDNPGGTQVPQSVIDRMAGYLVESNANLGASFRTSRASDAAVAEAREAMADFLNAPSADEIVFGQNMTTLTLHLSRSLGRYFGSGDEVLLSRMDHDGNVSPWLAMARDFGLEVKWLPFDTETFEFDLAALKERLTSRTRLVCMGAASNFLGTINDVKTATRMAHEVGAWTYIDAVQAAPHITLEVQDIDCDFLVCSATSSSGRTRGYCGESAKCSNASNPARSGRPRRAAGLFRDRHPEPRGHGGHRGGGRLHRLDW